MNEPLRDATGSLEDTSTRHRILVATAEVLARSGQTKLSLSEVALQAGVSRPTLYRWFASKGELLDAVLTPPAVVNGKVFLGTAAGFVTYRAQAQDHGPAPVAQTGEPLKDAHHGNVAPRRTGSPSEMSKCVDARITPVAGSTSSLASRTPSSRENGMRALRHFYASVLLGAGESIKALAEYLGHSDPGLTLKVYAHLMPSSRDRARKALGRALRPEDPTG